MSIIRASLGRIVRKRKPRVVRVEGGKRCPVPECNANYFGAACPFCK